MSGDSTQHKLQMRAKAAANKKIENSQPTTTPGEKQQLSLPAFLFPHDLPYNSKRPYCGLMKSMLLLKVCYHRINIRRSRLQSPFNCRSIDKSLLDCLQSRLLSEIQTWPGTLYPARMASHPFRCNSLLTQSSW